MLLKAVRILDASLDNLIKLERRLYYRYEFLPYCSLASGAIISNQVISVFVCSKQASGAEDGANRCLLAQNAIYTTDMSPFWQQNAELSVSGGGNLGYVQALEVLCF
jgi:hypothetical protein